MNTIKLSTVLCLSLLPLSAALAHVTPPSAASALQRLDQLPIRFEPGADAQAARYAAFGTAYALELQATTATLKLSRDGAPLTVRSQLLGASAAAKLQGEAPLPGKSHYFTGSQPSQWRRAVPQYARVRAQNVYPGIDLVYYGNGRELEYDFVLAPQADASRIALGYSGTQRLSLDAEGNLLLHTAQGTITQHRPLAYQTVNGERRVVASRYQLSKAAPQRVTIALGAYDRSLPLTIDPVLSYSSYLGNNAGASAVVVDSSGNIYIAGSTSSDFPTSSGAAQTSSGGGVQNAFIAKLNSSGTALLYATYVGGSGYALAKGLAVDSSGNAYLAGLVNGSFPTTEGALQTAYAGGTSDGFITKLNADGSALVYSTYLGGTRSGVGAIAVDSSGNAYLAGTVAEGGSLAVSSNAAQSSYGGGSSDAFVARLNAAGSALSYASYLGGAGEDYAVGIGLDAGDVYVAGNTTGSFPASSGAAQTAFGGGEQDAFVAEFDGSSGGIVYASYVGGSGYDGATALAVDSGGSAVLGGYTTGSLPVKSAYQSSFGGGNTDGFVAKLALGGGSLVFASYLGGSGSDQVNALALDSSNRVYVAGDTTGNFPLKVATQSTYGGGSDDAFVAVFAAAGNSLLFSSYLGGSADDTAEALAVDANSGVYVVGSTTGGFPTTEGAYQTSLNGAKAAFAVKIASATDGSSTDSKGTSGGGGGGGPMAPGLLLGLAALAFGRRWRRG